ncbi:Wzz/FepE/Etk N-terminal domain-containing protein [Nocardioides panaciterrulae]|uniref:Polysaccharide chain length determinant N-terminal domain-containing protein n=1 Tax=Nocardioides panaciterrulae TaxID=661492 RepID=A0A7Y9JBK3_9ACTN|nr:Wzz/FepE/Etk N-terminal domain-containing protein [Nocardioides panaciterrulae]NYD43075.1 hypothetical protein [Nocardioides panaciterrulae]
MPEQMDVRSAFSLIRRRRRWLAAIAILGALLGVAFVTWKPPLYTSTSKVLLPVRQIQANGEQTAWEASTQVSIAESDAVLGPAASAVSPALSRREVHSLVSVSAPTPDVLDITAHGTSGAAATALARAVAQAEIAYQQEAPSSLSSAELVGLRNRRDALQKTLHDVEIQVARAQRRLESERADSTVARRDASALAQLTAQQTALVLEINSLETKMADASGGAGGHILDNGSSAKRPRLVLWYLMAGVGGAALAVALSIVVMVGLGRRDAKLGTRDEIADAIGSEVIASLRSQVPRSVAAWSSLLERYTPSVAEGWTVRLALAGLGLDDLAMRNSETHAGEVSTAGHRLCVLSLEDDPRALSLGPQVASYAASIGISTRLVPEQGDATAALWAACSSAGNEEIRPHLRVSSRRQTTHPAELTVLVSVLDRRSPQMPPLHRSAIVVLAVSSRAASSEDLARAAVVAYEAGFRISGVLVADPDPLDKTTGRQLPHERLQQQPLPSRGSGPRPVSLRDSSWKGGAS